MNYKERNLQKKNVFNNDFIYLDPYLFFTYGVFIPHRGSVIKFETMFNPLIAFRELLKVSFAGSCIRYRRISSNYFPTRVLVKNPQSFATYVQAETATGERERERDKDEA